MKKSMVFYRYTHGEDEQVGYITLSEENTGDAGKIIDIICSLTKSDSPSIIGVVPEF